jgi:hypothetical protein
LRRYDQPLVTSREGYNIGGNVRHAFERRGAVRINANYLEAVMPPEVVFQKAPIKRFILDDCNSNPGHLPVAEEYSASDAPRGLF